MTQIQLFGHDLKMAYNLQTAISYERMTGNNPLDFEQFQTNQVSNSACLAYCMLLSNNDPQLLPDFEDFVRQIADVKTMTDLFHITAKEMQAFYMPDKGEKSKRTKKEAADPNP